MSEQPKQSASALEQTYANALLDLAWAQGPAVTAEIEAQLRDLLPLLASDPLIKQLLASRVLSTETRRTVIERAFKGKVNDLVYRFLQVVNDKERMDVIEGIIHAFIAAIGAKQGKLDVQIYVAAPLGPAESSALASRLGEVLGKTIVLQQQVDARLIGGLKIRIADEVIDGSVLTQLASMREQMIIAGRAKARAASLN